MLYPLSTYTETRECDFKERHYSVRDNEALYRHSKSGKPASKLDNSYIFGNKVFARSRILTTFV